VEVGISTPNDWTDDEGDAAVYEWTDHDDDPATDPIWLIKTPASSPDDDKNDEYTFGTHLKVALDLSPITVEVGAVTNIHPTTVIGFGTTIAADLAPATVTLSADVNVPQGDNAADATYEADLDVSVAIGDGVTVLVGATYSTDQNVDAVIDVDAEVDALTVGLLGIFADLAETNNSGAELNYIVELDASYTTDTVKPYLTVGYGTISAPDDDTDVRTIEGGDPKTNLTIGCEAYLIENVTFKGEWSADPVDDVKGNITLSAKIEY